MPHINRTIRGITILLLNLAGLLQQNRVFAAFENKAKALYLNSGGDEADLYARNPALCWLAYLLLLVILMAFSKSFIVFSLLLFGIGYFTALFQWDGTN